MKTSHFYSTLYLVDIYLNNVFDSENKILNIICIVEEQK